MRLGAFAVIVAVACSCFSAPAAVAPFDAAESLIGTREMARARDLYIRAAATDPDPVRRDRALIRAASLDWYVFRDAASARVRLAAVRSEGTERARAWVERARLEADLIHDYDGARAAARHALESARTSADRASALTRSAAATVEESRRARIAGTCADDEASLMTAIAELRQAIDLGGPLLEPSRLLLEAALMSGDGQNVLQAWRWYYADRPAGVAVVEAQLVALAPDWTAASGKTRSAMAAALARSRLFEEADLVLRDPCAKEKVAEDRGTRDLVAYAATLRRLVAITDEHYRNVARKTGDEKLEPKVMQEAQALWKSLSWDGKVPPFSPQAALAELGRRFGTIVSLGKTDDIPTLLMGHTVIDETRDVEQYGRKASLRFVQIDGMVSSGYMAWLTHDATGVGGWSGKDGSIYQIRPMYADAGTRRWRRIADPEMRAEAEREIADESARDLERARTKELTSLPGLQLRLPQQATIELRDRLAATGLAGDALRDAVISALTRDKFDSSIWAHEGRHAIDKTIFGIHDNTELEYRAKLSEIAFARSPRLMGSILDPIGGASAHGRANERILTGIVAWMRKHASDIAGLDPKAPLLPQLDKLTDEQIRIAFRSLDPLASGATSGSM